MENTEKKCLKYGCKISNTTSDYCPDCSNPKKDKVKNAPNIEDTADFTVYIPKTDPHFATSLAVIPLQLLGYYVSVAKGLDVDKPRNLAKSVTVE